MTGLEAVASCSCGGLALGHRLESIDLVPPRKGEKSLLARRAMRQIGLQDALDGARRLLRDDVAIEFAPKRGVGPKAAADRDVITLDRVGVLIGLHFAGKEADFRDEMLRAGVMTAGQVDVDRRVERDARFTPARDL